MTTRDNQSSGLCRVRARLRYGIVMIAAVAVTIMLSSNTVGAQPTSLGYFLLALPNNNTNIIGGQYEGGDTIKPASPPVTPKIVKASDILNTVNQYNNNISIQAKILSFLGASVGGGGSGLSVNCLTGLQVINPR